MFDSWLSESEPEVSKLKDMVLGIEKKDNNSIVDNDSAVRSILHTM